MTVNAKVTASIQVTQSGANAYSGGPHWSAAHAFSKVFADGVAANQANIAYIAERTVASASNDDIDLYGVLSDALGETINAAELVTLFVLNEQKDGTQNTTDLTIGGHTDAVDGFLGDATHTIGPLKPGALLLLSSPGAAGLGAIVATYGDILRIANSSGAQAKYVIGILARSS
jgi:hypothetical protein